MIMKRELDMVYLGVVWSNQNCGTTTEFEFL
jgi:hypothetical protein